MIGHNPLVEIQSKKILLLLFKYIQDNSDRIDV